MKNEVAVFTTNDLQAAGINSQLTSNDLVEVVAHDIYDKYVNSVNEVIERGAELYSSYNKLMDAEVGKMKSALGKYLKKTEKVEVVSDDDMEDENFEGVSVSFSGGDKYWGSIKINSLTLTEKEKGTFVTTSDYRMYIPDTKPKTAKVTLTLATGRYSDTEKISVGNITGTIETQISKKFTQSVTIPTTRFKAYVKEVEQYNADVKVILNFLPKNGALSVERFTREARVKMNKKIISAQSPDFRKKISELFNIKL